MKITKIYLKEYLHFKNDLEIDLTYPVGHKKAGKPLEKVCFIGQSATGKTTLLNLIKFFSFEERINPYCLDQKYLANKNVGIDYLIEDKNYKFSKWSNGTVNESVELFYECENNLSSEKCKKFIEESLLDSDTVKLISFPFDVIRNYNFIKDNLEIENQQSIYKGVISKPEDILDKPTSSKKREDYLKKAIWDFSIDDILWLWEIVSDQMKDYEPEYRIKAAEHLAKCINDEENAKKYTNEFIEWKSKHENPLKKIAQKSIDPIINKFNLEVKTDINLANQGNSQFIQIQQVHDKMEVPDSFLSTGTKQIMLSSLPLSVLNIDKAIILFDEPERSLFPDTQLGLIKNYTSIVPNSQFFFATHSPIVASAFDPCERIILYFDENNRVDFKRGSAPEGDDPNDLLYKDFELSNILEEKGLEAYSRYIELKALINAEKDDTKKEAYMSEFLKIEIQYSFSNETNK